MPQRASINRQPIGQRKQAKDKANQEQTILPYDTLHATACQLNSG